MLPSGQRLRRASEFRAAYEAGRAYPDGLVVLHVRSLSDRLGICQVGFSVGKKVGNAVVRNRIKRRLRAIISPLLSELPEDHHLVFGVRSKAAKADFRALREAVHRVLDRSGIRRRSVVDSGDPAP